MKPSGLRINEESVSPKLYYYYYVGACPYIWYVFSAYKKRDRPSLNDEVWCLKNIRRNGDLHKDLLKNKIKTVKDLLRLNTIGSLREVKYTTTF